MWILAGKSLHPGGEWSTEPCEQQQTCSPTPHKGKFLEDNLVVREQATELLQSWCNTAIEFSEREKLQKYFSNFLAFLKQE